MDKFLAFLHKAKAAIGDLRSFKTIHLVLGNESCDLDSTVSALSLAYLIHSQKGTSSEDIVIPVMNVEAKYFPLRTETCYLLKKFGIDWKIFIFKNEIKYSDFLSKIKTSIVDHHVLAGNDKILEESVVQIFDHRPINHEQICKSPGIEQKVIETVGSCSTLITKEILNSKLPILFEELSQILYATIIYDTIALNQESGRAFKDDLTMAQFLESSLKAPQDKKQLMDLLWKVHNDTSSLTTKDILYRDLKIVKGVPIPGLPMLVEDYLKRNDADDALTDFASEYNSANVVLVGIDASGDVRRDIGLVSSDKQFKATIVNIFKTTGADLLLTEEPVKNKNVVLFKQGNIKLTRKFIVPLVNEAVSQCEKKM